MNGEKGITIVGLIIVVILMTILLGVGLHFGKGAVKKARVEDIKTEMISIKTRAKIIVDEFNFKDIENLKGTLIEDQSLLSKLNVQEAYLWSKETLNEQGLSSIDGDKYAVSYNLENPNNCEVYYLDGYEGVYSLTALQAK